MELRLKRLQKAYPGKDAMEVQDALVRNDWVVARAFQALRTGNNSLAAATKANNSQQPDSFNAKEKFTAPKKAKLSRYSATAREVDEAEGDRSSDSEGEYYNSNVVYDSEDDSEDEGGGYGRGRGSAHVDEANLSEDKRRVLRFFNDGTPHELACIQGCSKKKVENIVELRPYEGWGDLVSAH